MVPWRSIFYWHLNEPGNPPAHPVYRAVVLEHPQRPFKKMRRVRDGGSERFASGAREAFVISREREIRLSLVVTEAQADELADMVEFYWANPNKVLAIDLNADANLINCRMVFPTMKDGWEPAHLSSYPGWLVVDLGFEREDGSPWPQHYFTP